MNVATYGQHRKVELRKVTLLFSFSFKEEEMKVIIVFLLLTCSWFAGYTQNDSRSSKNSIFIEAGANSIAFGVLNYDRILIDKERWKLSGRLGFSILPNSNAWGFGTPLEFGFLIGKTKHFFEVGIGTSYFYGLENVPGGAARFSSILLISRVGYRLQKPDGGIFFKVGINTISPVYEQIKNSIYYPDYAFNFFSLNQRVVMPYVGMAIGYTFKPR